MSEAGTETLHTSQRGAVLELRLEHGKANEIGTQQLDELDRLSARLESDPEVRALVSYSTRVSSRGTPIFVAGANVTERVGWDDADVKRHVARQRAVLARLRQAPVFHVVVVSGVAFGWGTEFLLTADYRIAAGAASFALPETGLGIVPGAGGTSELAAEIGLAQVLRLGMTGERLDRDAAQAVGLVQESLPSLEDGLERARALAAMAATRSPTANAAFKRAALASIGRPPAVRMALEAAAYAHCVDTGQAAIGRTHFAAARRGEAIPWTPRNNWSPDDVD